MSGQVAHHDITAWLLDGMSNHGFSGGPVIIQEQESEGYRVFGVVSSYVPANVPVSPAIVEAAAPAQVGVAPPSPDDDFFQTNSGARPVFDDMVRSHQPLLSLVVHDERRTCAVTSYDPQSAPVTVHERSWYVHFV